MAKFINNSKTATQNRRMAAQGYNLGSLCAAITVISEAAKAAVDRSKFGFSEGNLPSKTHEEMAVAISETESYGGGYMYGGDYATIIGGDPYTRFQYRTHWSREYDKRNPATFEEGNLALLNSLAEGTTLRLGYSGQNSSYEEWELKGGQFVHTISYCGQTAQWEEQNLLRRVYLFSGIRASVAAELSMAADYGFHVAFDEAVRLLDE